MDYLSSLLFLLPFRKLSLYTYKKKINVKFLNYMSSFIILLLRVFLEYFVDVYVYCTVNNYTLLNQNFSHITLTCLF